jgi:preprotein translocase subunit YajC
MFLLNLSALIADAATPTADAKTQTPPFASLVPMVLIFIIFYFVLIRPQQKKAKQQQEMNKTVKSGDKIVTTSGIIATVVTVKDDSISVRSADSKFEITKGAIAEIRERAGEASSAS